MSWNYSGDPVNSDSDWVRWKTGLTDSTRQLVTDEEISAELSDQANRWFAAAEVAESVAALFSRDVDFDYDDIAESASQAQEQYEQLAARLRERGQKFVGDPEPIFESENEGIDEDGEPLFHVDEMANS